MTVTACSAATYVQMSKEASIIIIQQRCLWLWEPDSSSTKKFSVETFPQYSAWLKTREHRSDDLARMSYSYSCFRVSTLFSSIVWFLVLSLQWPATKRSSVCAINCAASTHLIKRGRSVDVATNGHYNKHARSNNWLTICPPNQALLLSVIILYYYYYVFPYKVYILLTSNQT